MNRVMKAGRRTLLTPEMEKRICDVLALGATYKVAAGIVGIDPSTFFGWMAKGRNGTLSNQYQTEPEIYIEFFKAVKKAEARSAIYCLSKVKKAADDGCWQAAAFILERRHNYQKNYEGPVIVNIDAETLEMGSLIMEANKPIEIVDQLTGPVIDLDED